VVRCPDCYEYFVQCPCCDEVFCPTCGMLENEVEEREEEENE